MDLWGFVWRFLGMNMERGRLWKTRDEIGEWAFHLRRRAMDSTPTLRFAVTSFGDWARAQKATEALRVSEKPLTEISYLGLRTVLKDLPAQALADLSFPRDGGRIACSVGPI